MEKLRPSFFLFFSPSSHSVQVVEGCAAGRFEPGLSFGRFECDYRDVCYRVYRLVRDGYLYRGDLNQQLVGYVPENLSATQRVSTATPYALVCIK